LFFTLNKGNFNKSPELIWSSPAYKPITEFYCIAMMKTLLIPVDFSAPSNNAVAYAAGLANHRNVERIVLLTNCYVSTLEQLFPSTDFVQAGADQQESLKNKLRQQLKHLKNTLLHKLNEGITVSTILSCDPLLRSVLDATDAESPDVILIGSNSERAEEGSYIGEHLIEIAKASTVPVYVVPPKSRYHLVTNALVPCDFGSLRQVGLLERLQKIKNWPRVQLSLLNVAPEQKRSSNNNSSPEIESTLKKYLEEFDYQLCYADDKDELKGIMKYADKNHHQLIIALPGRHSFLYNLTHQSISQGLAADARQPVLILK